MRAVGRAHPVTGRSARLAYADPPYPGLARRYYSDHRDYGGEVDHRELIDRLRAYDGWALSTSAGALPVVLGLCPPGARVAVWVRGERPTVSDHPLSTWEPVIFVPARSRRVAPGERRRVDALVYQARARTTDPARVIGAKPAVFAAWVFDLLAAEPTDEFNDLYPGSGAMTRAWATYSRTD